ncbi:unnamed protein product [Coccothraustes coccothraustes]
MPVAVLSKARLLPKAACDRHLASDTFRLACSASLSACMFAESFSTLSHKEKLCLHRKFGLTVFAVNASYVWLRSSRLSSGRAVRLPEAKKRLLCALSIVPVAVPSKARLLLKAARDRCFASGSSRLASSASLGDCIFAESFSTLSHKEKLC